MTPVHFPLTPDWLWWAQPWFFLALLALPLAWWLWRRRERRPVVRFSGLQLVRAAGGDRTGRWRALVPILRTLALVALIVACARPQHPDETSRQYAEGVAIQLVVDVSGSMEDTDLSPARNRVMNRLDVVKQVIRRFVLGDGGDLPGRPNDLVGLVRFARYADSVCPLTLDHANLIQTVDRLEVTRSREEDGTAIGDGLGLAVERLRDLKRTVGSGEQLKIKSRIVILLTDGENNQGMLQPEQAGDLAATQGIKVYTIMAGTGRMFGDRFRAPLDDRALRYIADATGGRHYTARDPSSLAAVYAEIDALERTQVEERSYLRWGELAAPWLLAAFAFLSAQMLLENTWLRRTPA